jgi:hypothetical protein
MRASNNRPFGEKHLVGSGAAGAEAGKHVVQDAAGPHDDEHARGRGDGARPFRQAHELLIWHPGQPA